MSPDHSVRANRRRLAKRLVWLVLVAPAAALYLPHVGRGFLSEDFLLVRLHLEQPPWNDLLATVSQPWLGMREVFGFYRPAATILFAIETSVFGGSSLGYNAIHVALHLLAAVLVALILRRLQRIDGTADSTRTIGLAGDLAALAGGVFFALYPLAPNSVMFVAAFPNLFGAVFVLASTLLYIDWSSRTRSGSPSRSLRLWVALLAFGLALGCYESSLALLGFLPFYELSRPGLRQRLRSVAVGLAGFFALGGGYLALRVALFGEILGGYASQATRMRNVNLEQLGAALRSMLRLPAPWFGRGSPGLETTVALALIAALAAWMLTGGAAARSSRRLGALGLVWSLSFLAPFGFPIVQPANGRYVYVASVGISMLVAAVVTRAATTTARRRRSAQLVAASALVFALLVRNGSVLAQHLGWQDRAARICFELAREARRVSSGGGTFFVTDAPSFLKSDSGVNLAQVFHYGLRAATGPPYFEEGIDVYPGPPRELGDPRTLARQFPVFRWHDEQARLRRVWPRPGARPQRLELSGPASGATVDTTRPTAVEVVLPAEPGDEVRVVVVTRGNTIVASQRAPEVGRRIRVPLPMDGIRFWNRLAGGPQFWWVERRDRGRTVALSEVRWFVPASPGAGGSNRSLPTPAISSEPE